MKEERERGRIVEIHYNRYRVALGARSCVCRVKGSLGFASGEKLPPDFFLCCGDEVEISVPKEGESGTITKVYPRRNALVRPYLANLDLLFIVVAPRPKPDFVLVDKILLNCYHVGVTPVLLFNKADAEEAEEEREKLKVYRDLLPVIETSAKTGGGLERIEGLVKGKFVAFAGQSAVGKTSLMSRILGKELPTDGLTKWERGKHTTRSVAVYEAFGGEIADTCGFSMLDAVDGVRAEDLRLYYDEYLALQPKCRFHACTHTAEPDCAVKRAVEAGELDEGRYRRYLQIYKELKERS